MSEFFDQLRLYWSIGLQGVRTFSVASKTQSASESTEAQQPASLASHRLSTVFQSGTRGADARAIVTAEGVVVIEGSFAAADEVESTPDSTRRSRAKLVQEVNFRFLNTRGSFPARRPFRNTIINWPVLCSVGPPMGELS